MPDGWGPGAGMNGSTAVPGGASGTGARRQVVAIAVAAGLLVLAAVAAVLLAGSRTARYAPDSPEGVYQQYLAAFRAGDYETAYASFSARVQAAMTLSAFIDEAAGRGDGDANVRVWIDRTDRTASRATLHLTLERTYAAGLQSSRYRYTDEVRLVRERGAWRIDERLMGTEPSYYGPP